MTIHYNGERCETDYNGPDYSANFHIFTLVWDEYKIEWYVDDTLKRRSNRFYTILGQELDCDNLEVLTQILRDEVYPKDPMNIIINLALQTGIFQPDESTTFPSVFEIDYVRYYQKIECNDPTIFTNISQLELSNDKYNFYVGSIIITLGDFIIQSDNQLELVANDLIDLKHGFVAENGSDFIARIDPLICSSDQMRVGNALNENNFVDTAFSMHYIPANDSFFFQSLINSRIKIYPNPTIDMINIELEDTINKSNFQLYLIDSNGKILTSQNPILEYKTNINMNNYGKGKYLIYVIDKISNNVIINNIIVK